MKSRSDTRHTNQTGTRTPTENPKTETTTSLEPTRKRPDTNDTNKSEHELSSVTLPVTNKIKLRSARIRAIRPLRVQEIASPSVRAQRFEGAGVLSTGLNSCNNRMTRHKLLLPIFFVLVTIAAANHCYAQSDEVYPIRANGKFGLADVTGKVVIPAQYDSGLVESPFGFFVEGLGSVQVGGKWGYIDRSGKMVIAPQFDSASAFREGLALVEIGGKRKFIDKTGKVVIATGLDPLSRFSGGLARVKIGDKWGYIDKTGRVAIEAIFSSAEDFSEGLAVVGSGMKSGYIDTNGKIVIEPRFDVAERFSEGLAAVTFAEDNGQEVLSKAGFIDKTGKLVIKPQFDNAFPFSEGLAKVRVSDKAGFIDRTGKLVIPLKFHGREFNYASDSEIGFKGGLAVVEQDGKFGYVDKTGKLVIPIQYQYANDFQGGAAIVLAAGPRTYVIDRTGKVLWEVKP